MENSTRACRGNHSFACVLRATSCSTLSLRHVAAGAGLGVAVSDLVDAPAQSVLARAVVVVAGVGPVADEDAAIGTVADVDAAVPRIVHVEDVRLGRAPREKAGAAALERLDVRAVTEEIQQIDPIAVLGRPVVALVDHHADDGVAVVPGPQRPRTGRLRIARARGGSRAGSACGGACRTSGPPAASAGAAAPPRGRRRVAAAAAAGGAPEWPRHRVASAAGACSRCRAIRAARPRWGRRPRPPPGAPRHRRHGRRPHPDDRVHRRAAGEAMISDVVDQLVRLEVRLGRRADELRAGHLVPEMADDGGVEEVLAVLVPVLSPRVDGA